MQRKNDRFVERLPLRLSHPMLAYVVACAFTTIALAVRMTAEAVLPTGYPFVSFFPAVILTSFLFGIGPGIFASILGGLFSWYMFIPPLHTFHLSGVTVLALGFYAFVCATEVGLVHLMQRANYHLGAERERSRALAETREMLFRELQHRVSNNLQVVAALIALQRRNVTDEAARRALDEASGRLSLIGKIGRALYDPSGQQMGVEAFVGALADDILEASGRRDITVAMDVEADLTIPPDAAVPVALILAEAINNAIEHGFAEGRRGRVAIRLLRDDTQRFRMEIADDGHGIPAGHVPGEGKSLGLRIASALAQQLGGVFSLEPRTPGGARALLEFPT